MNDTLKSALEQKQLLKKIRDFLEKTSEEVLKKEEAFAKAKASMEVLQERLEKSQKALEHLQQRRKSEEEQVRRSESEKETAYLQLAALKDVEGLLTGRLFQRDAQGAKFFVSSLPQFALEQGVGEMTIEAALRSSEDQFRVRFLQKTYYFLRGGGSKVYFHPRPLDTGFELLGSAL